MRTISNKDNTTIYVDEMDFGKNCTILSLSGCIAPLIISIYFGKIARDLHNRNKEFGMQKDFSKNSFSEIPNYPTVSIENPIDARELLQLIVSVTVLLVCFSFVIPFF